MGESRYSSGGCDKYGSIMNVFDNGIYFNQPASRICDSATVAKKITRFKDSTAAGYIYTPNGPKTVYNHQNAVQLEFFVDKASERSGLPTTVRSGVSPVQRQPDLRFPEYSRPIRPIRSVLYLRLPCAIEKGPRQWRYAGMKVENTYVQQSFGGVKSEPGGQILVNGNVIIGSGDSR